MIGSALKVLCTGAVASLLWVCAASAQVDLASPARFSGLLDVRLVASDAERTWLEGGFGKTRFGTGDADLRPVVAEAVLVWTPRLSDRISGVVSFEIQDQQDALIDVSEAYVVWRDDPGAAVRLSGRAGVYFPLISLEHDGPDWAVTDTLTPSAINAWVAEELKVVGAEATARVGVAGGSVALTAGVFGYDDKAGTLLAFRGWALHDLKATASSVLPVSPVGGGGQRRAEPLTTQLLEIDDRVGAYARLEWRPSSTLALSLFGYDNAGDRTSRIRTEGAWDTRFLAASAAWTANDRTRVRFQAMAGDTEVGRPGGFHVLVDYAAAYASVTREVGPGTVTARLDRFLVEDRLLASSDNNDETGWASTLAYRWDVRAELDLTVEGLRIFSDRPSRARLGERAEQTDLQLQVAVRQRF